MSRTGRTAHLSERKDVMDLNRSSTVDVEEVKTVVVTTLDVQDRADQIDAATPLAGHLPELDSMGAMALLAGLEERFDVRFDDEDLTEDVFATLGSLTALVESKTG